MATKQTQCKTVLAWLKTNGELTTREAVTELNVMSLPRRIMELRRAGHDISLTYRTAPSGARYGVYRLEGEANV